MVFTPRLVQILYLLVISDKPVPAKNLAGCLQISKRTVFRELSQVNRQLQKYHLSVDTKSKKGIVLAGNAAHKDVLLHELKRFEGADPQNRSDRQWRLILALLLQKEANKIYYFSSLLQVSDGTVVNDLEMIEPWFHENNIRLVRKSGVGIYLESREADYRKACLSYICRNAGEVPKRLLQFAEEAVIEAAAREIAALQERELCGMTEPSYYELLTYMVIMISRLKLGKTVTGGMAAKGREEGGRYDSLAVKIASFLAEAFGCQLSVAELSGLSICLKGIKMQHVQALEPASDLQDLIYEMILQYDPRLAVPLKMDEGLLTNLTAHLKPTIVRLQHGIEITNPFQEEIVSMYPEIYEKTKRAAVVLENRLGIRVPDNETGLLALHFGGAQVRLRNKQKTTRRIRTGIICASGIGISAMLMSKINGIFHHKVSLQSLSVNDIRENRIDDIELLISSFELPEVTDYVHVNPLLTDEDIRAIAARIEILADQTPPEPWKINQDVLIEIDRIEQISKEIGSLLKDFDLCLLTKEIRFEELVRYAGRQMGADEEAGQEIVSRLFRREAISTQVIPEFEITLLHTATCGVEDSKLRILCPADGSVFTDPYFSDSRAVVIMLIPEDDRREYAISCISQALFDDEVFLEYVKTGRKNEVKTEIEKLLKRYLTENIKNL